MMPSFSRSRQARAFVILIAVLAGIVRAPAAEDEVWADNPWGRVTIFGSGALGSRLFAEASGQPTETKSLFYLDTLSLPAEIESFAELGGATMTARARLGIEASNDSGLLLGGSASLIPEGAGATGFASIHVFLLIELLDPAVIQIHDLMSVTSEADGSEFSIVLFPSDPTGNATGAGQFEFSGASSTGWNTSFASYEPGFFLLQVSATADGGAAETTSFDFRLDIADIASVPEPSTAALVIAGGLLGLLAQRRARRSRRR